MVESVNAQRISFVTLFKILYIGNLIFPTIVLIVLSTFSFFGFEVLECVGKGDLCAVAVGDFIEMLNLP